MSRKKKIIEMKEMKEKIDRLIQEKSDELNELTESEMTNLTTGQRKQIKRILYIKKLVLREESFMDLLKKIEIDNLYDKIIELISSSDYFLDMLTDMTNYEDIIKKFFLSIINQKARHDIVIPDDILILKKLYQKIIDKPKTKITKKIIEKIEEETSDLTSLLDKFESDKITSIDFINIQYNLGNDLKYHEYLCQFDNIPKPNPLIMIANIELNIDKYPSPHVKKYNIIFIDYLITICYFLKIKFDDAKLIINEFKEFDDNDKYYINDNIFYEIDLLLKLDREIGVFNTEKTNGLLMELVKIQNNILIKLKREIKSLAKPKPSVKSKQTPVKWKISRTPTGVHKNDGSISSPILGHGNIHISSVSSNSFKKYLKYKIKYLILKNQINI